jgi:cytochrome P450
MAKAQTIDQSYLKRPDNDDVDHIPGDFGIPYFGNSLSTIFGLDTFVKDRLEKYGPVSKVKMLHQKGIFLQGSDNLQKVYLDRDKNFSAEMGFAESLGQFYNGGILMKDFADHKFLRRMMQTAFKNAAMKNYVGRMNPIIDQHIKTWDSIDNFQFFPHIKQTLLEVGADVFIGAEAGETTDKLNQAFLDINDGLLGQVRKEWPGTKYNKGKKGERYLRDYFAEQIDDRREGDGADMLSFMCREKTEEGEFFDKDLITPQASFLLFAAHDTTTSLLNHMMYYSAIYPEWQTKMRDECLALDKPFLEYEDLDSLPSMQQMIFECLRLRPSVPFLARRTINECELDGQRIPADTMIFMSPITSHRNPEFWSNPEEFDPDRFSEERREDKNHSFAYMPFGGGAHKCIGMHFAQMLAKCFMHQILLNYNYTLPEGFKPSFEWVPLPKPRKLPIQWERR